MLAIRRIQVSKNIVKQARNVAKMTNRSLAGPLLTRLYEVSADIEGHFEGPMLQKWKRDAIDEVSLTALMHAVELLKTTNIPVAFPTETVYGLGADATRSSAVKGIYKAKGRPSDNPLIIHICDTDMLREVLCPSGHKGNEDPIPPIYEPLIQACWPGPLTILLKNPADSKLAPEVTAGLKTFAVRMPDSALALTLIQLAGVPLAGPSANASTKPSPTSAQHVYNDLNGKIDLIIDGGVCDVGVESTVVDGLCDPPVILRPGGLSIETIRKIKGWERVEKGYEDQPQTGDAAPRAPGMKYKHYSPKAKVVLVEGGGNAVEKDLRELTEQGTKQPHPMSIGVIRTRHWNKWGGWENCSWAKVKLRVVGHDLGEDLDLPANIQESRLWVSEPGESVEPIDFARVLSVSIGPDTKSVAHGLFSALRALDLLKADIIYVEAIPQVDGEEGIADAVMNRLRKAASSVKTTKY